MNTIKRTRLTDAQKFQVYTAIEDVKEQLTGMELKQIHAKIQHLFDYIIPATVTKAACQNFGVQYATRKPAPKPAELKQAIKILARCMAEISTELSLPCNDEVRKILDRF